MNSFEKKLGKECTALNILLRQKNKGTHDYFCMHIVVIFKSFFENLRNITWILLNQANAIYIWFFNSSESKLLGEKLRAIGDELIRSADILEGKIDDTIHVFNEQVGKMEKDIESKNLQKSTFK